MYALAGNHDPPPRVEDSVFPTLLLDFSTMTVGIVALPDDEFESGKMRTSGETLRKRP
jgi:hypothetical protein